MKREEITNYNNNSYRENSDFKQNFNERRNKNYVSPHSEVTVSLFCCIRM
jgi:hypothetical protein